MAQHVREDPWGSIWEKVELPLKVTQTAAFLEVVHAVLRFVRSGPFTSFLQGARRGACCRPPAPKAHTCSLGPGSAPGPWRGRG